MKKIADGIVKSRVFILILAVALMIPSVFGMIKTRINYDMLSYLPDDIETVQGQDMMMEEFNKGAFTFIVTEGMSNTEVAALKSQIEDIDCVESVLWYDSFMDLSIPTELLPEKITNMLGHDGNNMLAVFFNTSISADDTLEAIETIRGLSDKAVYVSGVSAMVEDLKTLCENEEAIYVGIAVILSIVAMMILLDNFLVPLLFLASIGIAIVYNLGTNVFLGEISFVTKALAAVLQLAVTMDYSIFLWHSYEEEKEHESDNGKAMSEAIVKTITSVTGSSITTIAGFIALCFMSYTMGLDLGIVMAKGVVFGVIGSVTILPAMILVFDKLLMKANHKSIMPNMDKVSDFVLKGRWIFIILALVVLVPGYYGKQNAEVYYNLSDTLSVEAGLSPEEVPFSVANEKLAEDFNMATTDIVLFDASMSESDAKKMSDEISDLEGISDVISVNSLLDPSIPVSIIPDIIKDELVGEDHQIMLINTQYTIASDEANDQINKINEIIKRYDSGAMLIGEAPCTKDLIEITATDFDTVNTISSIAILIIIFFVLKSVSLPFILVAVIQLAIIVNLGIPYYTNTSLPFIAPVCITTIQLGATVDYAILMTVRYKNERLEHNKKDAVKIALSTSIPSIFVSALGLFAATFGVAVYSDIDIIASICVLMARGAIISMFCVILVLPSLLYVCDGLITKTTIGMKGAIK